MAVRAETALRPRHFAPPVSGELSRAFSREAELREIPPADNRVHLVFINPGDQPRRPELEEAITQFIFHDVRLWFAQQLGGQTFARGDIHFHQSALPSTGFQDDTFSTAIQDVERSGMKLWADNQSGEDQVRFTHRESIYVLAGTNNNIGCNQGAVYDHARPGGIVAEFDTHGWVAAAPENDPVTIFDRNAEPWVSQYPGWELEPGVTNPEWRYPATALPGCYSRDDALPTPNDVLDSVQSWKNRSRGVWAHELGHSFAIDHPNAEETPDFNERLMGAGWMKFDVNDPSKSYLSEEEKQYLRASEYFTDFIDLSGTEPPQT